MRRVLLVVLLGAGVALGLGLLVVYGLPRLIGTGTPASAALPAGGASPDEPVRKIRATLYYIGNDGLRLVGALREVAYDERPVEQARLLVEELLKPAPHPLAQALPPGTSLRAIFLTDRGDAFVDFSEDVAKAHTGGSLDELFSVYAIVNSLTVNLPAIKRVQILVVGKEVDTLAGHVDIREPLGKNLEWVEGPGGSS